MPNIASEPIKDLISKILVVDVTKRFTIEQIKQHPAFHLYYPEGYIFPRPLPHPPLDAPMDIQDPEFFKLLKNVGYESDEQIKEELTSEGPTSAKLFHGLYSRRTDLTSLPWSSSPPDAASDPLHTEVGSLVGFMPASMGHTPPVIEATAGTSMYESFKESQAWGLVKDDDLNQMDEETTFKFPLKVAPAHEVCAQLQQEYKQRNIDWFFPNDQLFMLRDTDAESFFFVTVKKVKRTACSVTLSEVQGDPLRFDAMKQMVEGLLSKYTDFVE